MYGQQHVRTCSIQFNAGIMLAFQAEERIVAGINGTSRDQSMPQIDNDPMICIFDLQYITYNVYATMSYRKCPYCMFSLAAQKRC